MAFLTSKCSVRRTVVIILLLVLIVTGGGLILWRLLPEQHKNTVGDVKDGGLPFDYVKGDAPPPNYIFNQCTESSTNCCNGVEGLCDVAVDKILYAGIHNAQSTAQDGFFILPNHQYNFIAALDYGYRVLNFDLGVCTAGSLALVHGECVLGTMDPLSAFTALQTWLDANPNEVVIVPIEINNNAGDFEKVDLFKLYDLFLSIPGFTERMYQLGSDEIYPTLRELIAADQRIILFHYNGGRCDKKEIECPPGFHDWFALTGESKFKFEELVEFDDKATACNITRGRVQGIYAINVFMQIPSRDYSLSLNRLEFLQDHIPACGEVNPLTGNVNIVFVDFWSEGDLPQAVQLHNADLVAKARRKNRSLKMTFTPFQWLYR